MHSKFISGIHSDAYLLWMQIHNNTVTILLAPLLTRTGSEMIGSEFGGGVHLREGTRKLPHHLAEVVGQFAVSLLRR